MRFHSLRRWSLGVLVAACGAANAAPVTIAPGGPASGWYNFQVSGMQHNVATIQLDVGGIDAWEGYTINIASGLNGSGTTFQQNDVFGLYPGFPSPPPDQLRSFYASDLGNDFLDGDFSFQLSYYADPQAQTADGITFDNLRVDIYVFDFVTYNVTNAQTVGVTLQIAAPTASADVPEPSSMALVGLALAGAACARRRRA